MASNNSYNTVYTDIEELFNELFPITNEYFSKINEENVKNAFHETIKGLFLENIKPNKEVFDSKATYYFNDGFDFTITGGSFLYNSSINSVDINSDLSIKLTSKKDSSVINIVIDKESFKNPDQRLTEGSDGVKRYTYNLIAEAVKDFGIIKLNNFSVISVQKKTPTTVTENEVAYVLKENNDNRNANEKERIKKIGLQAIKKFLESGKFTDAPPETIKLIADTVSDSLDKTELEIKEQLSTSDELAAGLSIFSAISNGLKYHFNNGATTKEDEVQIPLDETNSNEDKVSEKNMTAIASLISSTSTPAANDIDKWEPRYNYLKSLSGEQITSKQTGEIARLKDLHNKYTNTISDLKWSPKIKINGGSRRTVKRGGKKTRRKAKRSQRRRSGRRGKRTSRR
jgi:hypothetical protein